MWYCIVLYCIVLYCIVLYCIVLYCIVLYCIVLYCIVLYCIVLYCIVLVPHLIHYNTLTTSYNMFSRSQAFHNIGVGSTTVSYQQSTHLTGTALMAWTISRPSRKRLPVNLEPRRSLKVARLNLVVLLVLMIWK